MEPDKNREQELAELIADPETVSTQHTAMLNELLQEYPYFQPLHLLLAKAGQEEGENKGLAKASLYTNGQTLHRFLFEKKTKAAESASAELPSADPDANDDPSAIGEDLPVVTEEPAQESTPAEESTAEEGEAAVEENIHAENEAPVTDEQETFEEISEPAPVAQHHADAVPDAAEETVFEEIGEVDYNTYRPFRNSSQQTDLVQQDEDQAKGEGSVDIAMQDDADDTAEPEISVKETETTARRHTLEDDLVFESIVSTDFFAFENNFTTGERVEEEKTAVSPPFIEEHDEAAAAESEQSRVSNYHDDKLPYTFLWWLAKTRKEHQSTFQPYAVPKKGGSQELQQQYVEHIFHMQSHLTGNEALLDIKKEEKPVSKDFQIIDSFIKNDPQIHPPNAEQIDNENKAKKSAEDQNDLVSETLANIYIEQMLYDKAIDTYEKLSLKFPEKSRYFADLIQSIEKKI
ncbi:hypothetical protein [Pedobacter hartonius]|uniref:Tetratricopeptide repeat-containing protein n=1 Tax=Pedobacter hartonius TaxID=425514 RepID=A0A1H3ZEL6_9SPHI|nr:hypothetical protein [Pedobacter hartonius]SEA22097.1 hypothetical protein SAMN05443550_102334 [Pedobacter hartonius]